MKPPLSLGALALAFAATTICAKAQCVGGDFGTYYVVCPPSVVDVANRKQPQQRRETALHPVDVHHQVAKRPKPHQADEKAPPVSPPPALPPAVTQKSPVDGLRAGRP